MWMSPHLLISHPVDVPFPLLCILSRSQQCTHMGSPWSLPPYVNSLSGDVVTSIVEVSRWLPAYVYVGGESENSVIGQCGPFSCKPECSPPSHPYVKCKSPEKWCEHPFQGYLWTWCSQFCQWCWSVLSAHSIYPYGPPQRSCQCIDARSSVLCLVEQCPWPLPPGAPWTCPIRPQGYAGVVYQVPCKDSTCVYTGETERKYKVSEKEQQHGMRSIEEVEFTWARKKDSVSDMHPSAITDHVTKNNHTIDWDGVKFPNRDSDTMRRGNGRP